MADLKSLSPCAGLLPLSRGALTLEEVAWDPIWSVAPYKGQMQDVSDLLNAALGVGFPVPGTWDGDANVRALWSGLDQAFLVGAKPPAGLTARAAVTDQSDSWACVALSGDDVEEVLARLVPVDLREAAFGIGRCIRTQVQHMACVVLRDAPDRFVIMAFRSMAGTLVHELDVAMQGVDARKPA